MLEKLLELDDIRLLPTDLNSGLIKQGSFNFGVLDITDRTTSLPLFANPSVISKNNWSDFNKVGIRPILSVTEDLPIRLEGCNYIFTQFTPQEIRENFLTQKRAGTGIFRIFIHNNFNGHSTEVLNAANELKKLYGPQVNVAAGNIISAKTYDHYCTAGIDYAFVGMGETDFDAYGFYSPLASLLIDITGIKANKKGMKLPKIVASGQIVSEVDIIKALALGADFVELGRPLASTVEASGSIYKKSDKKKGELGEELNRGTLLELSDYDLSLLDAGRMYCISSLSETRSEEVKVNTTLKSWMKDLYKTFTFGFMMSDSTTWEEFHSKVHFGKVI